MLPAFAHAVPLPGLLFLPVPTCLAMSSCESYFLSEAFSIISLKLQLALSIHTDTHRLTFTHTHPLTISPPCFIFSITSTIFYHIILFIYFVKMSVSICDLSPKCWVERKLHEGRDFCLLYSLLSSQSLEQCLAQNRAHVNECMNVRKRCEAN